MFDCLHDPMLSTSAGSVGVPVPGGGDTNDERFAVLSTETSI